MSDFCPILSDFPPYFYLGLSQEPLKPQMNADKRRYEEPGSEEETAGKTNALAFAF
jgi:hypothetical protein